MRMSVVIPVRDDARMLDACLQALAAQSRRADEVVVVDNASSDDGAAVARRHGAQVVAEPVVGIPRAAATGYDAATGDVIARLDADSVPGPGWLAALERAFEGDPPPDFVTGGARFYGASAAVRWAGRHLYIGGMYGVLTPYLGHPPLYGSNMAMRAEAWRTLSAEVHRDDPGIHDDLDLSFHIRPDMTVRYLPDLIVDVSARPFDGWPSLRRRLSRVVPTLRLHPSGARAMRHRRALRAAHAARR